MSLNALGRESEFELAIMDNKEKTEPKATGFVLATRMLLVLLFAVMAVVTCVPVCFAAEGDNFVAREEIASLQQKAEEALLISKNARGLQTEIPLDAGKPIVAENERWFPFSIPTISKEMAQYLLYASLIVIALAIIPSLRANMWSSSRSQQMERKVQQNAAPSLVAIRMEKAQIEADELARQGNFAEAMHVLLLQSVSELRSRLNVPIAVSLTSREILRGTATLTSDGRAFLADIIGRVEVSYFGTHLPDGEEYLACRRNFDALVNILRQGSP